MHCTYGTDRAGIVSFILEAVLGVSEENAIREYMLSPTAEKNKILLVRDGINQYDGLTFMERAEAFLLDCGITDEQISSLREIYIDMDWFLLTDINTNEYPDSIMESG